MKKLIAAALCITAIAAQALEIKGLTPGDQVDCGERKRDGTDSCTFGMPWEATFLGQPNTFWIYATNGRLDRLTFVLKTSELHGTAIAAFSEKYGKPIVGSDERRRFALNTYITFHCDFHRWQEDEKQLEITACKHRPYPGKLYDVELKKIPKAPPPLNKSDI